MVTHTLSKIDDASMLPWRGMAVARPNNVYNVYDNAACKYPTSVKFRRSGSKIVGSKSPI